MVRAWEEAGCSSPAASVLPHLDDVSFRDAATLAERLRDVPRTTRAPRSEIAAAQRASVVERLSYAAGMRRMIDAIAPASSRSTARAPAVRMAAGGGGMKLSYVIVTRNRREHAAADARAARGEHAACRGTRGRCSSSTTRSDDGTAEAVAARASATSSVIRLRRERGHPRPQPRAAAGARASTSSSSTTTATRSATRSRVARLPRPHTRRRPRSSRGSCCRTARLEAPAFPSVHARRGERRLRASVLEQVGGFAPEFFRQAEEYDLSFRIWQAGLPRRAVRGRRLLPRQGRRRRPQLRPDAPDGPAEQPDPGRALPAARPARRSTART